MQIARSMEKSDFISCLQEDESLSINVPLI